MKIINFNIDFKSHLIKLDCIEFIFLKNTKEKLMPLNKEGMRYILQNWFEFKTYNTFDTEELFMVFNNKSDDILYIKYRGSSLCVSGKVGDNWCIHKIFSVKMCKTEFVEFWKYFIEKYSLVTNHKINFVVWDKK